MFSTSAYCERTAVGWWQEPLNTWSNLFFLLAALAALWYCRRRDHAPSYFVDKIHLLLCIELFAVGIASWIFHASGKALFETLDTLMILVFLATATFALLVRGVGFSRLQALLGVVALVSVVALLAYLPLVGIVLLDGVHYIPAVLALLVIALLIRRHAKTIGNPDLLNSAAGIVATFIVLLVSLTMRTLDIPLCDDLRYGTQPLGTHFLWHTLNALALFLVIASLPKQPSKNP